MDEERRGLRRILPGWGYRRHQEREVELGKWRAMVGWETTILAIFLLVFLLSRCGS